MKLPFAQIEFGPALKDWFMVCLDYETNDNLSRICLQCFSVFVLFLSKFCHNKTAKKLSFVQFCTKTRQNEDNLQTICHLSYFCLVFVQNLTNDKYFCCFCCDKFWTKTRQNQDKLYTICRQIVDKLSFVSQSSQTISIGFCCEIHYRTCSIPGHYCIYT